MVTHGVIKSGEQLLFGPDMFGNFKPVTIKSVHVNRSPTKQACTGQAASFALKHVKRCDLRKGMVLMHPSLSPRACVGFEAKIRVLHHPTKINTQSKYEPIIHVGNVRQAALLIARPSQPELMGTGDRARVLFHFCHRPEYIPLKSRFIFSEGRTRGVGTINSLIYVDSDEAKEILDHMAIRRSGRSPARKGSHTNLPSFASLNSSPSTTTTESEGKENKRQDVVMETGHKRSKSNDSIKMVSATAPILKGSKSNVENFVTPTPPPKRQSKSKSPPNRQEQILPSFSEESIPPQNSSIFRVLNEQNNLEQNEKNIMKQKETKIEEETITTTTKQIEGNFGNSQDTFFNLGLSTIFSTRIDDDRKTKEDDDDNDSNNGNDNEDEVKDEKNLITSSSILERVKSKDQDKPRRSHPFPFTSPSYLKSLEKNKLSLTETGPKKRNRKRTRSKKNTQDGTISVRRKSTHWISTDQDEKENNITR